MSSWLQINHSQMKVRWKLLNYTVEWIVKYKFFVLVSRSEKCYWCVIEIKKYICGKFLQNYRFFCMFQLLDSLKSIFKELDITCVIHSQSDCHNVSFNIISVLPHNFKLNLLRNISKYMAKATQSHLVLKNSGWEWFLQFRRTSILSLSSINWNRTSPLLTHKMAVSRIEQDV